MNLNNCGLYIPLLYSLLLPSILTNLVMEKRDLILIVGSTGSGKSTTIAAILDYRNANCAGLYPDRRNP